MSRRVWWRAVPNSACRRTLAAGAKAVEPAPGGGPSAAPAAARLRVRAGVDAQGRRAWDVVSADGTVVSQHPNADLAIRAARKATDASIREAFATAAAKGIRLRPAETPLSPKATRQPGGAIRGLARTKTAEPGCRS